MEIKEPWTQIQRVTNIFCNISLSWLYMCYPCATLYRPYCAVPMTKNYILSNLYLKQVFKYLFLRCVWLAYTCTKRRVLKILNYLVFHFFNRNGRWIDWIVIYAVSTLFQPYNGCLTVDTFTCLMYTCKYVFVYQEDVQYKYPFFYPQ